MYRISNSDLDFILNDLQMRGIENHDLRDNLLDHICCLIETDKKSEETFQECYLRLIPSFYKVSLQELEDETRELLLNKHHPFMKKLLMIAGLFSVVLLGFGLLFKFLHWPGASILLTSGIGSFSLLFLPLLFILRLKQMPESKDRIIAGLSIFCGLLFALSVLFRIMHWPGAMVMGYTTIILMVLGFLPLFLYRGLRKGEARMNTAITAVLVFAGCGLFLAMVASPRSVRLNQQNTTRHFLRNQQILSAEMMLAGWNGKTNNIRLKLPSKSIHLECEQIKELVLERVKLKSSEAEKGNSNFTISDGTIKLSDPVFPIEHLREEVIHYNKRIAEYSQSALQPVPVEGTILDYSLRQTSEILDNLIQIQMILLQNERLLNDTAG